MSKPVEDVRRTKSDNPTLTPSQIPSKIVRSMMKQRSDWASIEKASIKILDKTQARKAARLFCELKAPGFSSTYWTLLNNYDKVNPKRLSGYVQRKKKEFISPYDV